MASITEIANRALVLCDHQEPITDIEDNTDAARKIRAVHNITRRNLLTYHRWNFATAWSHNLPRLTNLPERTGLNIPYQKPPESLIILRCTSTDGPVQYHIEGDVIWTRPESLNVKYIRDVDDGSLYPPYFDSAYASAIAIDIVWSISGNENNAKRVIDVARQNIIDSVKIDHMSDTPDYMTDLFSKGLSYIGGVDGDPHKQFMYEQKLETNIHVVRRNLLTSNIWNFSLKKVFDIEPIERTDENITRYNLPPNPNRNEFEHAFLMPEDALLLRRITSLGDGVLENFKIYGNIIYTDNQPINIEYISDVMNSSEWPPYFRDALSYDLALSIVLSDSRQKDLQNKLIALKTRAIQQAQFNDAIGDTPDAFPDIGRFIAVRGTI